MDTVVLSDIIGVNAPGRAAIRSLTNSRPSGVMPLNSDFAAGRLPPKLHYEQSKFGSTNPIPNAQHTNLDPNAKMKEFKARLKLSKSIGGPDKVKSTGLFSFDDIIVSKGKPNSNIESTNNLESSHLDHQKLKPINMQKATAKNKAEDVDFHHRINRAFQSIESLGKDYNNFDKDLKAATARAVADGKNSRKLIPRSFQRDPELDVIRSTMTRAKSKKPMGIIDVTRPINKMFGLDVTDILKSSGEETGDSDYGSPTLMKKLSHTGKPSKPSRERRARFSNRGPTTRTRSPSPLIADISDKRFLARHEKQGNTLNKDIAGMKNQLEVMDKRSDRETRKANLNRNKSNYQRPSNITRLMAYNPNQGTGRELTNFLQSNGGICGGWDPEDHNIFMTIYRKWKSRPARVIDLVKKEVGDKKVEEIAAHISWYEKYEVLNNANKAFIRQWQIAKRREKEQIYRTAKKEKMAQIESDKRKHEIIRVQREEERERNRMRLDEWKSSIALEKKMMRINADLIREPGNESRIDKLQEAMENIKKGFTMMQPKHPAVRKYLTSTKQIPSNVQQRNSQLSMYSGSSGVFSEYDDDRSEFSGFHTGLTRTVTFADPGQQKRTQDNPDESSFSARTRKPSSKIIRQIYQSRDAQMVETRRQAIKAKLEEKRNKSLLTTAEIKQRVKAINAPSKLMSSTKGWTSRQQANISEKLEALERKEQRAEMLNQHNDTRVPTEEMFQPGTSVRLIPKLGTPSWRQ